MNTLFANSVLVVFPLGAKIEWWKEPVYQLLLMSSCCVPAQFSSGKHNSVRAPSDRTSFVVGIVV
jgi:hypothetical protein